MANITIKDIARESGYATGTVSRALNNAPGVSEEARAKILKTAKKYNFQLNPNAKYLKQKTRDSVAILIRGKGNIFFSALVEELQKEFEGYGYDAIVYYFSEDEDEVIQAQKIAGQRSYLGILFLGSTRENFRRSFSNVNLPCVLVTNSAQGLGFQNLSSVSTDDSAAAQYAVEYLFSKGHENIGVLGGFLSGSQPARSRYMGVQYAYFYRDRTFDQRYYVPEHFTMEGGYKAMNELLDRDLGITAVFVVSDTMAVGAVRAILDRGLRVPDDISVVGFDGLEITRYYNPRLTTICQDTTELARKSAKILISSIDGGNPPVYEEISFLFQEGESVRDLNQTPGE